MLRTDPHYSLITFVSNIHHCKPTKLLSSTASAKVEHTGINLGYTTLPPRDLYCNSHQPSVADIVNCCKQVLQFLREGIQQLVACLTADTASLLQALRLTNMSMCLCSS